MQDDPRRPGPLRLAIAEMRAELGGLIERESARLLGEAQGRRPLGIEAEGDDDPMPRAPGEPRAGPALRPSPHPPRATPTPPAGPPAGLGPRLSPGDEAGRGPLEDDSERRLDALAARLEGRLRRARDRAGDRPGPEGEGGRSPGPDTPRGGVQPGDDR